MSTPATQPLKQPAGAAAEHKQEKRSLNLNLSLQACWGVSKHQGRCYCHTTLLVAPWSVILRQREKGAPINIVHGWSERRVLSCVIPKPAFRNLHLSLWPSLYIKITPQIVNWERLFDDSHSRCPVHEGQNEGAVDEEDDWKVRKREVENTGWPFSIFKTSCWNCVLVLSGCSGYHKGYGEKLRCSQAQPGQAITSAVDYFPSIPCLASWPATQYRGSGNGFYVVWRNFFLLLLNCFAWTYLGPA